MSVPSTIAPDRDAWKRDTAVLVSAGLLVGALLIAFAASTPWWTPSGTGPNWLWFDNRTMVAPGTPGCADRSGEVCFAFGAGFAVAGVKLSTLRFALVNETGGMGDGPQPPSAMVGASASVTVLTGSGAAAGVWNWSDQNWSTGGSWAPPAGGQFLVVLDTGLQQIGPVLGDMFYLITTTPYRASVGMGLFPVPA
jgi:hypothetical protein